LIGYVTLLIEQTSFLDRIIGLYYKDKQPEIFWLQKSGGTEKTNQKKKKKMEVEGVLIVLLLLNSFLLAVFMFSLFKAKTQIDKITSDSFQLMTTRLQNMVEFRSGIDRS